MKRRTDLCYVDRVEIEGKTQTYTYVQIVCLFISATCMSVHSVVIFIPKMRTYWYDIQNISFSNNFFPLKAMISSPTYK